MARVALDHVWKTFAGPSRQQIVAVEDLSLDVADGEFMVLVGPSGCGKTTTLRLIAGLEEISRGKIEIGGRAVHQLPPKDRDVAMVFQNYALYPHMTVYENMAFALKLRKVPKLEIRQRVFEVAEMLGLASLLDRLPKALSGGQRQRVAVGRAIVRKPKVFLFDEPLSNLDAKMRVQLRIELAKLHQQLRATMIYVTHDQVEAMTLGQRIAVLDGGRIQQVADPMMLYRKPANLFVAGFIGSPPMNFWRGTVLEQAGELCFQPEKSDQALRIAPEKKALVREKKGREILLGVRPEAIRLGKEAVGNRLPFAGNVELMEVLGAETVVHLNAGGTRMIGKLPGLGTLRVGEGVSFGFDMEHAYFFDAQTKEAI